ncbi:alpha/beta fold hydrolase [Dongia sp. agr-C8]
MRLRYIDWEGRSSIPAVMLHGLRGYAETWESLSDSLGNRFRLLALDQRGRGGSEWGPWQEYRVEQYVADLESFVDQLGLGKFVLIGHSMGGANAIVYAARHPERVAALVIEDMGPGASTSSDGSTRIRSELGGTPESFASWAEAEAYWRARRPNAPEEAVRARMEHTLRVQADGRLTWRYDLEGIRRARLDPSLQVDLWPYVSGIRCPTLVVRGAESDFLSRATAEEMAKRNENLRWVEIARASHYVHDDNPEDYNREVSAFLSAVAG